MKQTFPNLWLPATVFIAMWTVFLCQTFIPFSITGLLLVPKDYSTLHGLLFSPFLHANLNHICGNSMPFLALSCIVFYLHKRYSYIVFVSLVLIPGVFCFFLGDPIPNLGISGVIFGLFGFLITRGYVERTIMNFAVSTGLALMFANSLIMVFPVMMGVSWTYHLGGMITGISLAIFLPRD